MGRKRKNKNIQTFEVYPEDLGKYQYLMKDLPKYQATGETQEDIDNAVKTQNTSEEDEQFQLMQQMMRDNPEMFKDYMPRYNTNLYGPKDDYTPGYPQYNPVIDNSPITSILGILSSGKNLVKGAASGFKTKYHGINPKTGLKYSMQDFKRHTITNPFDDTRLMSADVAKDIIYNKNKDYTRGDLFKTPQQANAMLMNDFFRDRHEMYKDVNDPTKAAFSLRTMDEFGNLKYSDIEAPNPNWDPDLINPDGTSVLSGNVEQQFITRPFNILTDLTQGDRVEDHLANASMQQMYYDNEGVITKFQSYNDEGELVWTNYNPNVQYGEYETTSQDEMNRRLNDPDYQGPGTIGGATDPFGTDIDTSEESVESNQDRQNRIRCEEEGKVYNPQTGQCDDAPEGRYGLEEFVYGGDLPKAQIEGEFNYDIIPNVSESTNVNVPDINQYDINVNKEGRFDDINQMITDSANVDPGEIYSKSTQGMNIMESRNPIINPIKNLFSYFTEGKYGGSIPKAQDGTELSKRGYSKDDLISFIDWQKMVESNKGSSYPEYNQENFAWYPQNYGQAFGMARDAGMSSFWWDGELKTTETTDDPWAGRYPTSIYDREGVSKDFPEQIRKDFGVDTENLWSLSKKTKKSGVPLLEELLKTYKKGSDEYRFLETNMDALANSEFMQSLFGNLDNMISHYSDDPVVETEIIPDVTFSENWGLDPTSYSIPQIDWGSTSKWEDASLDQESIFNLYLASDYVGKKNSRVDFTKDLKTKWRKEFFDNAAMQLGLNNGYDATQSEKDDYNDFISGKNLNTQEQYYYDQINEEWENSVHNTWELDRYQDKKRGWFGENYPIADQVLFGDLGTSPYWDKWDLESSDGFNNPNVDIPIEIANRRESLFQAGIVNPFATGDENAVLDPKYLSKPNTLAKMTSWLPEEFQLGADYSPFNTKYNRPSNWMDRNVHATWDALKNWGDYGWGPGGNRGNPLVQTPAFLADWFYHMPEDFNKLQQNPNATHLGENLLNASIFIPGGVFGRGAKGLSESLNTSQKFGKNLFKQPYKDLYKNPFTGVHDRSIISRLANPGQVTKNLSSTPFKQNIRNWQNQQVINAANKQKQTLMDILNQRTLGLKGYTGTRPMSIFRPSSLKPYTPFQKGLFLGQEGLIGGTIYDHLSGNYGGYNDAAFTNSLLDAGRYIKKYGGALPKFQEEGEYPNDFLTGFPTLEEAQNFDPTLLFAEEEEDDDTPELNTEEQRQNWENLQEEVQYKVATKERNKLQDVALQDTDVTSSWRAEGEKGISGALSGAYRWADARFKTGVPGRIVKGMGDIGGLLDPIWGLSEYNRIQQEKEDAKLSRTGKTSGDMFATIETSSRGNWDPHGGMFKPDKSVDEIRGTVQEGKETTLTGSTPQGGPDYSMLQEFTGDDLPFPYDPAFLEWQKLTLGINGGDLPKAQTGNKEKIKDYKNVWGTNKRETNAIIEDLINQGFDFETDTILRNPQATELRRAQNAFLDANARENISSGNITGEPSTNRSSWGDYMYQAYEKFFNKQDGGQTVDIDSAMLKELIAAGADIEII